MTENEIQASSQRYQARIRMFLTPEEQKLYDAYQQRVADGLTQNGAEPVMITPAEQAVLDTIATDTEAAALYKQLMALMRVEHLPQ